MKWIINTLGAVIISSLIIACDDTSAQVQTSPQQNEERNARAIVGASPYQDNLKNEPAPKLIVDPPLPDLLDKGVVWIQWRP